VARGGEAQSDRARSWVDFKLLCGGAEWRDGPAVARARQETASQRLDRQLTWWGPSFPIPNPILVLSSFSPLSYSIPRQVPVTGQSPKLPSGPHPPVHESTPLT